MGENILLCVVKKYEKNRENNCVVKKILYGEKNDFRAETNYYTVKKKHISEKIQM